VYLDEGELRAEHAFWIFDFPFMVLHYPMTGRAEPASRCHEHRCPLFLCVMAWSRSRLWSLSGWGSCGSPLRWRLRGPDSERGQRMQACRSR
jgi:hypothetical protein